jgi:hypothetical protein
MKLSQIQGERTYDVIADLIPPVITLAQDEKVADLFKAKELPEGMTTTNFMLGRLKNSVPYLIKNHKEELSEILATIEGVEKKDYIKSLNLLKLSKDIMELISDEDFVGFFVSAQSPAN